MLQEANVEAKKFVPKSYDLKVGFTQPTLEKMITTIVDTGASDIKIQSGDFVTIYYQREWFVFTNRRLEDNEAMKCLSLLVNQAACTKVSSGEPVDFAPEFFRHGQDNVRTKDRIRLRLNARAARVGRCPNGVAMTLRTIKSELPELDTLGLPEDLVDNIMPDKGLVLMSGQTGSGKTTTIAGCLHERTKQVPMPCIISYEQPVEFAFDMAGEGNGPLVVQCDIGIHLKEWSDAGTTAMRSKADIILMGEVRDVPSAEATMEMAITGHMVYATLHADTPNETVYRIIEMFQPEYRSAAASKFLSSLRLIVSQKLVKTLQGDTVPLHSWINFDYRMKDEMSSGDWTYDRWGTYVKLKLRELGQDFATQVIPLIREGRINVKMLGDITLMGRKEAQAYFDLHSTKIAPKQQEIEHGMA